MRSAFEDGDCEVEDCENAVEPNGVRKNRAGYGKMTERAIGRRPLTDQRGLGYTQEEQRATGGSRIGSASLVFPRPQETA